MIYKNFSYFLIVTIDTELDQSMCIDDNYCILLFSIKFSNQLTYLVTAGANILFEL